MLLFLEYLILIVYFLSAFLLLLYGLNSYVMIFLFLRNKKKESKNRQKVIKKYRTFEEAASVPFVTTQIPVFNEFNVAKRIITAACHMQYPKGRHEIQVLDDSNDETVHLIDQTLVELKNLGHDIKVIRRVSRLGFKAGALAHGMKTAKGEFITIFDADFVPPRDFLLQTIPFFLNDSKTGLVQARWGHLNRETSLLTRAQSMGIDGHFMVEQSARNWGGLFMNFNGTAGTFRTRAIINGGGWQWDTLTEDMDLSYRIQFAGWKTVYNPDLIVPAEIPEDISAFKNQQFRWAKGSIQTAMKLWKKIYRSPAPAFKKLEAFFHLTHYAIHFLMVILALLALPVMGIIERRPAPALFTLVAIVLIFAVSAPSALYVVSQRAAYMDWKKRLLYLPFLVVIGTGIAVSNARAVIEALIGLESEFVRTPKKGDKHKKKYPVKMPWSVVFELLLGIYCSVSLFFYLFNGKYIIGPFLFIYAVGFLFVGVLTLMHTLDTGKGS